MAINPNNGIPSPNDQNSAILAQFAASKKNLLGQKDQALDQANQQVARNQAITGLSGGSALKAGENAAHGVEQTYTDANTTLEGQKNAALQGVAQTQESQAFAAGQSALDRSQQASQFAQSFKLSTDQFNASKDQFAQQMQYQWGEFAENQKTNLINSVTALNNANLGHPNDVNKFITAISQLNNAMPQLQNQGVRV